MIAFLLRHKALSVAMLALLAAAGAALRLAVLDPADATPSTTGTARLGGAFELSDRDGKPFTDKNLLGRPFAIYFGYTRCPDVCPTTLRKLATWRRSRGAQGEKLQIVFVSVDPQIDTPASVGAYADLFRASIIGITGTPAQVARIADAYRVIYTKVPQPSGGYNVDHSTYVYLGDAAGRFVDVISPLDTTEEATAKLRRLDPG
jgi:protein SCO1